MPIKAVTFDLEGTLIDVESVHVSAWEEVVQGLRNPFDFRATWEAQWIGAGDERLSRDIAQMPGQEGLEWQELLEQKMQHYDSILSTADIAMRPGFIEVYRLLLERSIPMAIGSLTPREQAMYLLQRAGMDTMFRPERIVLLEDVRNKKPAPDVYIETARRMNVSPRDQLVFEDSPPGVEAALNAGSRVVAVPTQYSQTALKALRGAHPDAIYRQWSKVKISKLID